MKVYIVMFAWWEKPEFKFVYSPYCDNTINDPVYNERIDSVFANKSSAKKYIDKKNKKINYDPELDFAQNKARYWIKTNSMKVRQ